MSSLAQLSSQVISPTSFLPYQRLVDISLSCRATSQDILAWEHFFCHRTLLPLSGLSSPSNISFSLVNIATTNKQFTVTRNMSNNSLLIEFKTLFVHNFIEFLSLTNLNSWNICLHFCAPVVWRLIYLPVKCILDSASHPGISIQVQPGTSHWL